VRILIVKTSSMGDVVHALPLAADLAAQVPGAQIDWLVEESFAAIPSLSRHVRRVHPVALRRWRRALMQGATWAEVAAAKSALRRESYDWVLDVQGLLKSAWMARWAAAPVAGPSSSSARERVAAAFYSRRIAIGRDLHAVERCRRLGAAVFGYVPAPRPRFDLTLAPRASAGGAEAAAPGAASPAVLLVNASRATKLWPEERWVALEGALAGQGLDSLLVWGTAEEEQRVARLAGNMRRARVAPRLPIDAIAAALNRAPIVVGLDTGLTHLAAALGRPTVGIYCDYDPALVGLVGDGAVASLGGVNQSPTVEAVLAAVVPMLQGAR
jgi:heptosyltransferase-1